MCPNLLLNVGALLPAFLFRHFHGGDGIDIQISLSTSSANGMEAQRVSLFLSKQPPILSPNSKSDAASIDDDAALFQFFWR